MFDADLIEEMYRASDGVEVVHDGRETWGHEDAPGDEVGLGDASFRGVDRVVTVAAAKVEGIRKDDTITVAGVDWRVRNTFPKDEGAELIVALGRL